MVRIAGLDSGKMRDSSYLVGLSVDKRIANILGAKRWTGDDYLKIEGDVADIHAKKPFDFIMVETNNVGVHVYEVLKHKYHLPVYPVTTSKDLKDPKKQAGYKVMDKNAMVKVMLQWFSEDALLFPKTLTPELQELKRQLSIFAEHRTESGSFSYYAEGNEHDDGVMGLMLACFKARAYMTERKTIYTTASRKFGYQGRNDNPQLGTGIPSSVRGLQSKGWTVRMP